MSVSPLQLRCFYLDELSIAVNSEYAGGPGDQHGRIEVSPSEPEALEDGTYSLRLHVSIGPDEGCAGDFPYNIAATARGVFTLPADIAADESGKQLLLYNGSALILGQVRAQVAQVTSFGQHGAIWIPVLNLVDLYGGGTEAEASVASDSTPAGETSKLGASKRTRASEKKKGI